LDDIERIGEGALEGLDDDNGVDVTLELRQRQSEDFTSENDDSRGSIADFFILCPCELNHALCGRVCDFDLSENGVAIVGEHNTSHRIEKHFQHGLGSQT